MSRTEMMSRTGPKDTKPELVVGRGLHGYGYRFRLQKKELRRKPDLVLCKCRSATFIHGCFWHAHEDCRHFKLPKTQREFRQEKLLSNRKRDQAAVRNVIDSGWRVLIVWERATREVPVEKLVTSITEWLQSYKKFAEILSDTRRKSHSITN